MKTNTPDSIKLNIAPLFLSTLEGAKSYKVHREPDERVMATIRCSKKQLWFLAYRSKEITGKPFQCGDEYTGRRDHPTTFKVGDWPDGSEHWARIHENKINGPFWVSFTLEFKG